MEARAYGRYLEDFVVHAVIKHEVRKTITESDNNLFSLLTMNHHPLHLDGEYANKSRYGRILVVGTYVFSLVVGMTVADISGKAIANLDYDSVTHDAPVFIGDTIHAETEILSVRESEHSPDFGIVYVETRTYNQNDLKVLTLRRHILIPKRGR